ncbi:hypothetical protein [Aquifex sp.]
MYRGIILLSVVILSCAINAPKMCPDKLSPRLKSSLNKTTDKLKVLIRVKEGYESKVRGKALGKGLISAELTKEEIYELSCKDWVLFVDVPKPLRPQ